MKKTLLFLISLALTTMSALAQTVEVKGTVLEDGTNTPMIGVTVSVDGTTRGVATDQDGKFTLKASAGELLNFSYAGAETQHIKVTDPMPPLTVHLKNVVDVEALVVVGYGVTRKRDISGAIASIKADDVKAGVITNTAQMLQGRAAGVQVRQNNAEPGGGVSIRVRGASSVSSNNEPLYVIDGFQTDIGNQINPSDIASIEILKDAASTAIYGARGANGVVIITTKKGSAGRFSVDYSYNIAFKSLYNPWDLMNAQDMMSYSMRNWTQNGSQGNAPYTAQQLAYTGEGTDWLSKSTQTATTQSHQISIAGGTEKLAMSISANYLDDLGVIQNTEFSRFSARVNLDYKLSNRVRFGTNIYAARSVKNYLTMGTNSTEDNIIYQILMASPMSTETEYDIFGTRARPNRLLEEINSVDFENVANNMYATVYAEGDILKTLTARVQYTYSNTNSKSQKYYPKNTSVGKAANGSARLDNWKDDNSQLDAVLTYHEKYGANHDFKFIGGMTYIDYVGIGDGIVAKDFSTDAFSFNNLGAAKLIESVYSNKNKRTSLSFFARAEYVLFDKYIINASFRGDGASNFGEGNKWGYFPSASVAWQIGDEGWMEWSRPALSSAKIRASYGVTGNDGIGTYLSLKKFAVSNVYLGGPDLLKGLYPSSPGNSGLKWETTKQFDVGLELGFVNDRIEVDFDYYIKNTDDLLNPISVSSSTGGFTTMMGNNGSVRNEGFELFIRSLNIAKPNFTWSTTLNMSRNKNTVTKLNNGEPRYESMSPQGWYNWEEYTILQEGKSMSSIYGYVFDGIIQTDEKHPAQPDSQAGDAKFKDLDHSGTITAEDREVIGDGNPDMIFGMANNFRIYDFDFSFFLDASVGGELLNMSRFMLEEQQRIPSGMDRWTKDNPSNTTPRNGWNKESGMKYGSYINSHFVENASYLRLSNIELGYNLPVAKIGNLSKVVKAFRVFVGAQNLFTITNYSGFSPETSTNGGSSVAQGLDYNSYPAFKTFNLGAKITF